MPDRSPTAASRWLHYLFVAVLVATIVWLLVETREIAERAGSFERRAILAEKALAASPGRGPAGLGLSGSGLSGSGLSGSGLSGFGLSGFGLSRSGLTGSGLAGAGAPEPGSSRAASVPSGTPGGSSSDASSTAPRPAGKSPVGVDATAFAALQLKLKLSQDQLAAVTSLLEQRNAEIETRSRESRERWRESLRPMPAGVRSCLKSLHECLRDNGYYDVRFLRAASLDGDGLHDVEFLETSRDGLAVAFVNAKRMTATLQRAESRLELRFFEGHRSGGGEPGGDGQRKELGEDGWLLRFDDVDGEAMERRLPFLIKGEGSYPQPELEPERDPTTLMPADRRQWGERLTRLIAKATLASTWRVRRLRGLAQGTFLDIELIGTDQRKLVREGITCARAAIEVNERLGVVSLLLHDGVLRQPGGDSTIGDEGYRMLLPGLTPREAIDDMLGMIVRR